jgi:hypothetical protein
VALKDEQLALGDAAHEATAQKISISVVTM